MLPNNTIQNLNLFSKIYCEKHPSESVVFLCISTEKCEKNNLLCTECIDSSGKDHNHQLISIRRFHSFLRTYSAQAESHAKQAQEVIKNLRREIESQIEGLENMSTCQLSLGVQNPITDSDLLRNKLQELASRNIWSKLHQSGDDLKKDIEEKIERFWLPTYNTIQNFSFSANKCVVESIMHLSFLDSQKQFVQQLQKKEIIEEENKNIERIIKYKENISLLSTKSIKKGLLKRYSDIEKKEILREMEIYEHEMTPAESKKLVAKKHEISISTISRWGKWWKNLKKRQKKQKQSLLID